MYYWDFIERFQTLITGILAVIAAIGTAFVIYLSAHAPLKAERKQRAEEAKARGRAHALALLVEIHILSGKAYHIEVNMLGGTSNPNDSFEPDTIPKEADGWRRYFRLEIPASLQDWHLAAAHPPPITAILKSLTLILRQYEWYINTSEDWKAKSIYSYVEKIGDMSHDLQKAIEDEYDLSTQS